MEGEAVCLAGCRGMNASLVEGLWGMYGRKLIPRER